MTVKDDTWIVVQIGRSDILAVRFDWEKTFPFPEGKGLRSVIIHIKDTWGYPESKVTI